MKALNSLWQVQQANPSLDVRLTYATTADPGHERGFVADGAGGAIAEWTKASEGGDTGRLRALMNVLPIDEAMKAFVRDADDRDLRDRLLGKVRWACGNPSLETVRKTLLDRLTELAADRHLLSSDGAKALHAVVDHVLGSGLVDHSQKITVAARAMAAKKAVGQRS